MQPPADNFIFRPVFAAWVFGCLALLAFVAALIVAHSHVRLQGLWALSALAPCAPLLYFAGRGLRANRRDAFEALPERACAAAALSFSVLGLLLGWFGRTWALSVGPVLAGIAFALCIREVRELCDWLTDFDTL